MNLVESAESIRQESKPLEIELERVRMQRFLNNFCGLLPGGYRRAPIYVNAFENTDERTVSLLQQFSLVDQVITELGFDLEEVENATYM